MSANDMYHDLTAASLKAMQSVSTLDLSERDVRVSFYRLLPYYNMSKK